MPLDAIRFIGFLPPSDPRWQEALLKTPHDLFHLPGYLSACAPHEGGTPLLFLLDEGERGMLVPLIRRGMDGFGDAFSEYSDLASPYGYPGPLYWGRDWREHLPDMHGQFESFLKQEKVVSLFLRLNPFLGASEEDFATLGGVCSHGPTVYMDLRDGEQSWKGINRQNRSFITQMLQQGHEVRIDQWDSMDAVIVAYHETMKRLDASPFYFFPNTFFEALRQGTAPHLHLATAFSPTGEVEGGCFFSEVGGLVQYYLMGTLEAFLCASPSKLLINALRLWGIQNGHHTLNLGGGVGASRDNLFEFKIRLSKLVANFSTVRKVVLPETYQALTRARGWKDTGEDSFFPIYRKTPEQKAWSDPILGRERPPVASATEAGAPTLRREDFQNILITSAGRRNALVLAFQETGRPYGSRVFVSEVDPLAPTCAIADGAFRVPRLSDPAFLDALRAIAFEQKVGLIVPTIDTELYLLAAHKETFHAAGTYVLVSTPEFVDICRDKWKTSQVFHSRGIQVPASWLPECLPQDLPEALFLKPRDGSSSLDTHPCQREDLARILPHVPNPIIQELLVGKEVTIDAFLDLQGAPIHFVPRERIRTLGGESIQGVTIDHPGLNDWTEKLLEVCGSLGAVGPITIQAFLTAAGPVLTEVNPRFGGGFPLARAAGGDYPAWILALLHGEKVEPRIGQYRRGLYMTRHYSQIFLETLPWER